MKKLFILLSLFITNCESFDDIENVQEARNSIIKKDIVKINNFNFNNSNVTVVRMDMLVGWLNDKNLNNKDLLKKSIQTRNTERVEITMLKLGAKVTEREKVNKLRDKLKLSMTGLTESQAIKIGKMLNSDYVIFGNISNYVFVDEGKTIGIDIGVKAVSIESGSIVFHSILSGRMKGTVA